MSETTTHRAEIEIIRRQIVHMEVDSEDVEHAMMGIDSVVKDCESIETLHAKAAENQWLRIAEEREPSGSTKLLQFHRGETRAEVEDRIKAFIDTLGFFGMSPPGQKRGAVAHSSLLSSVSC